jgi:hypothetical protein
MRPPLATAAGGTRVGFVVAEKQWWRGRNVAVAFVAANDISGAPADLGGAAPSPLGVPANLPKAVAGGVIAAQMAVPGPVPGPVGWP